MHANTLLSMIPTLNINGGAGQLRAHWLKLIEKVVLEPLKRNSPSLLRRQARYCRGCFKKILPICAVETKQIRHAHRKLPQLPWPIAFSLETLAAIWSVPSLTNVQTLPKMLSTLL